MSYTLKYFDAPLLRYTGGKHKLADWIIAQMPPHLVYCEPYSGGAAVLFRKSLSKVEVINDKWLDLINFFKVLRDQPEALVRAIDLTPYARAEYELAYIPSDDPLESARRFYVKVWQSFGAYAGRKTGWRQQRNPHDRGTVITSEWSRLTSLNKVAQRLKNILIECDDALPIIDRYDNPETLFYVDPPYVLDTRSTGGKRARYMHEMSDADHIQLSEKLHQVNGMVLLSGYDCPLYRDLYRGWDVRHKSMTTNGNSKKTETIWISPSAANAKNLKLETAHTRMVLS